MKKVTSLILLFMALLWAGTSFGETVTIGTGTSTARYPLNDYYVYSRSQCLYLASEFTTSGTITNISWYRNDVGADPNAIGTTEIWLMETSNSVLTGTTWEGPGTLVATISNIDLGPGGGWLNIPITPFYYSGSTNLLVSVRTQNAPYTAPHATWRYTSTSANYRMRAGNSDSSNPPTMSLNYNRPNIQFEITPPPPCSGTPEPGNTISSTVTICPEINFTLSLQNLTSGTGVTYQWESSATGSDPWTGFGTSTSTATTSQIAETYYRCQVTCSGNTGISNPVLVGMNDWINCYCTPTYSSGGGTDGMTLVVLGTLSQATVGNVSPYYYDYTTTQNAIPDLSQTTSANLMITFGSDGSQYNGVWIDFDQSGTFEITEFFTSGTNAGSGGTATVVLTVPGDASLGLTRMRIRGGNDSQLLNTQACGVSSSGYGQAQDYFVNITEAPPCVPPSGLTAGNFTTTSADLGWTENGTATQWNVEYGNFGFTQGTGTMVAANSNPFPINGLSPATKYSFYVQADCGSEMVSTWNGPGSFVTLCEPSVLPFAESFESADFPPVCWENTGWVQSLYGGAHSGAEWAYSNLAGSQLISPEIEIPASGGYQLSFWYRAESSSYPQDFDVLISTDGTTFTPVMSVVDAVNTTYTEVVFKLLDYNAQNIWVRFDGLTGTGGYDYGVCIDDVTVDLIPPPGFLAGIVRNASTTVPMNGVLVTVNPSGLTTTTTPYGLYEIELEVGTYSVTFTKNDFYPETVNDVVIQSLTTTTLNANLVPIPAPWCADVVSPLDGTISVLPDATLNWAPSAGSPPPLGYYIQLFNLSTGVWMEGDEFGGTDLGNVTSYVPANGWDWATDYVWLITPYNNAGSAEGCIPWYFTTTSGGILTGTVYDVSTGLPIEGVNVFIEQTYPPAHAGSTFNLLTDADGTWNFEWESGVYKITYSKFTYFTKAVTNIAIYSNQTTTQSVSLTPVIPYSLPFVENWNTGTTFATQQWSVNPAAANWSVYASSGNPAPSARFFYNPRIYNYERTLESYFVDGTGATKIYAQFDLFLQNYDMSTLETMSFMVYDGTQWNTVAEFDNQLGDIPWTTFTYDISNYTAGHQFLIGFKAAGDDSFNIDWWYLDNILITTTLMEVTPPSIVDALFNNETSQFDVTIQNTGNRSLFWTAEVVPPSPWITFPVNGVTPVGTDIYQLTLDASVAAVGENVAQVIISGASGVVTHTIDVSLKKFIEAGQKLAIPEPNSWGYISSYINLNSKITLEEAFADIIDEMVLLIGESGLFWPSQNINTIGNWSNNQGYKLKMDGDGALVFIGEEVTNKIISFTAGVHLIPVLSDGPVSREDLFEGKPIEFAFGMDGSIYWPAGNIFTLNTLYPGYGYMAKFTSATTLDFTGLKGEVKPNTPPIYVNKTTWNEIARTGDAHFVSISEEACGELLPGDFIGVFNQSGLCTGLAEYRLNEKTFAVTVYADDNTTTEIDGMTESQPLQFKVFRNGASLDIEPVYNFTMPNFDGLFAINGLSQIKGFKVGSIGISENDQTNISIYPNPSSGIFNIDVKGFDTQLQFVVLNSQGQEILTSDLSSSSQIDLTSQPRGVYFVKIMGDDVIKTVKLIVK